MEDCCKLVGNLDLGLDGCIISISNNVNTEVVSACGELPLEGPTNGSLNITAYASSTLWRGCPSKAGVSIPYVRKYDCENDQSYFIFNGKGQSFYTGEANEFVTLDTVFETTNVSINASSQGGPSALYTQTTQYNGYGMTYTGSPIPFETSAVGTEINLVTTFSDNSIYYLQSFNLDLQPAQFPIVTYSFVYSIGGDNYA